MNAIKYLLAGAVMTMCSAPIMAQDVQSQIDAITKVIVDNKANPDAAKDQVKDFVKENKKNAVAIAGVGRAYLDIKDTLNAKKYAEMAIDRDKKNAAGYLLMGDIAVFCNDGGGAATWYQQATVMDPKNPQGYIKYANIYRKRSPELSVEMLEKLRTVQPDYPVDAEAGHFFYTANRFDKAIEYFGKVDMNKFSENYLTEYATATYLSSDSKKSLEIAQFGVQKNPRDAAMNRLCFYNYTDLKDYPNALKFADALFNKSDSAKFSARDYQYYGYALMGDSAYDQAIVQFEKALELNSKLNDVKKQLSDAYIAKKDYVKGLALYDEYLKSVEKPSVSDIDGLAKLYADQAASIATLNEEKIAALKKADEVYGMLGEKYPTNLLYATIMRARINSQLDPETTQGLAKPYYEQYIELAKKENPDNPKLLLEPYSYLGYYYYLKEDKASSDKYWKLILEIDPNNGTAKQALGIK